MLAAAVAEAMRPGATVDSVVETCAPARARRHAGGDRRGRRGGLDARRLARRRSRDAARRLRAVRLGGRALRQPRRSAHASRAGCTRSRSCRSRSGCSSPPAATSPRRCSAASTTAATRTRSRRWAARSRARSAGLPRCARTGSSRSRRRAATTSRSPAARWRPSRSRSTARDLERHAARGEAMTSLTAEPSLDGVASSLEGDVDPARGSDRARAAPGAGAGEGRRRDRGALARRGRRAAPARGASPEPHRPSCARSPRRCSTRSPVPSAAGCVRAGGLRGDRRRVPGPPDARAGRRIWTAASAARGSGRRSAACSASPSRASRARESVRSRRAPATGPSAATSPLRGSTRRPKSDGRGTALAARPACSRTSTACPRTTTSTSRCWPRSCSNRAVPRSRASTSRRRGSTICRLGGSSRPSGSRCRNLLLGLLPPETATLPEPVPRVDRRPAPRRRLRVGCGGRPAARSPDGVGGREGQPHGQRRLRGDVHGRGARSDLRRCHRRRGADVGLQFVPAQSRLAEAIRFARAETGSGGRSSTRSTSATALCTGCTRSTTPPWSPRRCTTARRSTRRSATSSRAAGTPTRTAPRSDRSSARSRASVASIALERRRCTTGLPARYPASTRSSIEGLAQRTLAAA